MLLVVGMGLFTLGADMAMMPMGEALGRKLARSKRVSLMAPVFFLVGVLVTVAEPDLTVLATQVPGIPDPVLIWTVAAGSRAVSGGVRGADGVEGAPPVGAAGVVYRCDSSQFFSFPGICWQWPLTQAA